MQIISSGIGPRSPNRLAAPGRYWLLIDLLQVFPLSGTKRASWIYHADFGGHLQSVSNWSLVLIFFRHCFPDQIQPDAV
jgi:hypothetical protein